MCSHPHFAKRSDLDSNPSSSFTGKAVLAELFWPRCFIRMGFTTVPTLSFYRGTNIKAQHQASTQWVCQGELLPQTACSPRAELAATLSSSTSPRFSPIIHVDKSRACTLSISPMCVLKHTWNKIPCISMVCS